MMLLKKPASCTKNNKNKKEKTKLNNTKLLNKKMKMKDDEGKATMMKIQYDNGDS